MKRALANYAEGSDDEMPVREKGALFELLDDAISQGLAFLLEKQIDLADLLAEQKTFRGLGTFQVFANILLSDDSWRRTFNVYENTISGLYEACKPEILDDGRRRPMVYVFQYLRGVIDAKIEEQDVDALRQKIGQLLDASVVTTDKSYGTQEETRYEAIKRGKQWDLRNLDVEQLKAEFKTKPYKHIEIDDLRAFIAAKLDELLDRNNARTPFAHKFQEIIDRYNAGGSTVEQYYEELSEFAAGLGKEEERHIREGLTEEELELFDVLMKEGLTKAEEQQVKLAAKELLAKLHQVDPRILIEGWYKDSQTQLRVKSFMGDVLDENLPESYGKQEFADVRDLVFDLVINQAMNDSRSWAVEA